MTKTIADIFDLTQPSAYKYSKAVPSTNVPSPTLLYGVELEIENASREWVVAGWSVEEDGSLRNGGLEFISKPMTFSNLVSTMTLFFDRSKVGTIDFPDSDGEPSPFNNYSERTSIHVHTNCLDMTLEQLSTLAAIYGVVERLLFKFIGNDRDKNIFCVPWYETTLSYQTIKSLNTGDTSKIRRWQKYTALNLLPLETQGTIEWRHMHGNNNLELIITWLRLIGRIHQAAMELSFKEFSGMLMSLNTTSQYDRVLDMVFREEADVLRFPHYRELLEEGVLDMKYSLMGNEHLLKATKDKSYTPPQFTWDVRAEQQAFNEMVNNAQINPFTLRQEDVAAAGVRLRTMPRTAPAPLRADFIIADDIQAMEEVEPF